jgi:TusA-related sulfurtransferase
MTASEQSLKVHQSLDVRGVKSPDSYRQARERLNGMDEDAVLELHIDDGEALRTLPFGLRAEGHEILVSEPIQGGVRLIVRKRAPLL